MFREGPLPKVPGRRIWTLCAGLARSGAKSLHSDLGSAAPKLLFSGADAGHGGRSRLARHTSSKFFAAVFSNVAEVNRLTKADEERQVRFGLGQVLATAGGRRLHAWSVGNLRVTGGRAGLD
jgi:hypothetical protein